MQETQETWVQSPGQEDPLEKGTATHFTIPAWRNPRTEEPGGLQSMGLHAFMVEFYEFPGYLSARKSFI